MLPIKLGRVAKASGSLGGVPPTNRPCHLSVILSSISESSKSKKNHRFRNHCSVKIEW